MLRFIHRRKIALERDIALSFLDGKKSDWLLRDFQHKGWIQLHSKAIQSRYSYGLITPLGRKQVGIESGETARSLSPTRLDQRIALATFCMGAERFKRVPLLPSEVRDWLGGTVNNKNHRFILSSELGVPCILRVYHAASTIAAAIDHCRGFLSETRTKPVAAKAVESGTYGLAVIVRSHERVADITHACERAGLTGRLRLVVGHGQTAESYSPADAAQEARMDRAVGGTQESPSLGADTVYGSAVDSMGVG
jgi:hypothetical protein